MTEAVISTISTATASMISNTTVTPQATPPTWSPNHIGGTVAACGVAASSE